ncbi:MAG: HAD hydrolase family protein [Endomicrobium sp.]|jgi:3-deoxy-D-manno-octulosonate 8-phosphate phosphatase (KDO 8-P phosphatase)|uniref:KdsC family phosphatase n=1 Tax=Candidatus Endomicrobiellum cubanum TaxID=3242325 RepID=UPI0028293A61|nr:HAD hydrolase family protein [Endomicrobium sp.]MDR2395938.1 HAD hydrolase family protein [Endomicrobium sp.]
MVNILEIAKNIKLLVCDVDGVLTKGEIIIFNNGEEIKIWNVKDGMGYNLLSKSGLNIQTAWITGRGSLQVQKRAKDIKIDYLVENCNDKLKALNDMLKVIGLSLSEVAYIGDDIIDISILKVVGFSACPKDATQDVKNNSLYVSALNGGEGIVREVIEIIMKSQGVWEKVLDKFLC